MVVPCGRAGRADVEQTSRISKPLNRYSFSLNQSVVSGAVALERSRTAVAHRAPRALRDDLAFEMNDAIPRAQLAGLGAATVNPNVAAALLSRMS